MVTKEAQQMYQARAREALAKAHLTITEAESAAIEIADMGLGEFERTGLAIILYVNTERCCAKELIMLPRQTCPEHRHPAVDGADGKEETFRCRYGTVYLYVEGEAASPIQAVVPAGSEAYYTVFHEIVLHPGEQYTLMPNTLHWFQAGADGAIVSEFSTKSRDESDVFTDIRIKRLPEVAE